MPHDQRILDIISSASAKKPADIGPIVDQIVGERVAELIDQRRDDTRANFFAEPEDENSTDDQPDDEETPHGEDA